MFYRKNLPGWERALRVIAGVVMIACGLLGPARHAGRLFDRLRRCGCDRDRIFRVLPDVRNGWPQVAIGMTPLSEAERRDGTTGAPKISPFTSTTLTEPILRGAAGLFALWLAIPTATDHPWESLALGGLALVALRGCPMCWTIGLVELASRRWRGW